MSFTVLPDKSRSSADQVLETGKKGETFEQSIVIDQEDEQTHRGYIESTAPSAQ